MTEAEQKIEYATFSTFPEEACGSVLVIGNFDGVHKGHRALITHARSIADAAAQPLAVLTFEPHPREVFRPNEEPFRLTPEPVKERLLHEIGVDYVLTLNFVPALFAKPPEEFVQDVLVEGIGAGHIVVGSDFCFGKERRGTADDLKEAAASGVFDVDIFEPVKTDDQRKVYSSSLARQAIREGDIQAANAILGWKWEIDGVVVDGDKRGREIGYPTANIELRDEYLRPAYGVYAVRVAIDDDTANPDWHNAVANVGIRPMFEVVDPLCEVHLFDFDDDLYGKALRVQMIEHIRPEMDFDMVDELKDQIAQDCDAARNILNLV